MKNLASQLSELLGHAFEQAGYGEGWGKTAPSDRPDLADFQCNDAMRAAKKLGVNPRQIAQSIADQLTDHPDLREIAVAGPGFLNLKLSPKLLNQHANAMPGDVDQKFFGTALTEKILLDFGGANVAKPMHVGHLRSAVIGDSLQRLFRLLGAEVTSDVHLGDWGLQMGHLITELAEEQPDLPYFDPEKNRLSRSISGHD